MIRTDICVCRWLIPQTEVGQITWWSRGSFLWQGWRFPDNVGGVEASCFRQVGAGRWQRVKDKVSGGTETSLCSLLCTESRTLQCVAPGLSCPVLSQRHSTSNKNTSRHWPEKHLLSEATAQPEMAAGPNTELFPWHVTHEAAWQLPSGQEVMPSGSVC